MTATEPATTAAATEPAMRGLRRLRVLAAAAVLLAAAGMRPEDAILPLPPIAVAGALAVCLIALNLIDRIAPAAGGRGRGVLVLIQIIGDMCLAVAGPWLLGASLGSPATLVAVVPVLEAGVRFRVLGAVTCWFATSSLLAMRLLVTGQVDGPTDLLPLGEVALILLIMALPAAYLAEHLVAQLAATASARWTAERRSELLAVLAAARRDLHALDAPVILEMTVQAAIRMGCHGADVHRRGGGHWRRTHVDSPAGGRHLPPTPGPQFVWRAGRLPATAEPDGTTVVQIGIDGGPDVLLLRCAVPERHARLVGEALEILAAEAHIALSNAGLHRRLAGQAKHHQHQADHDPLTGLRSRGGVTQELERIFVLEPRPPIAVLFVDLDAFKPINDRFGHDAGDGVLVTIAQRLRVAVGDRGLIARFGGDEFLVVHHGPMAEGDASAARARLTQEMALPITIGATRVRIGASIGMATCAPGETSSPDALLRAADAMMYADKDMRAAHRASPEAAPPRTRPTTRADVRPEPGAAEAPRDHKDGSAHGHPPTPD